jgi:hypothetical protein
MFGLSTSSTSYSSGLEITFDPAWTIDTTPPSASIPATQTVLTSEGGSLVFGTNNGNAIAISDNGYSATVSLSVDHGALSVTDSPGSNVLISGNGSNVLTLKGDVANINALINNNLTYTTSFMDATEVGDIDDTLTIGITDRAGNQSAPQTVNFDVTVACFYPGTMIRTPDGEVAVETLQPGDLVLTADGVAKKVNWLGKQTVSTRFADPLRVLPIRIRAGALDDNVPARDLLVSPDHAMFIDGVMIHASALVNGTSIMRETNVPRVFTYLHIELDEHSLVLAENASAETFVDNADRLRFDNLAEFEALYPEGRTVGELPYPRAKAQRQVPVGIRQALAARAEAQASAA